MQMTVNSANANAGGETTLANVAGELWSARRIIGWIALATTLLALIAAIVATPKYEASVLLAPVRAKTEGGLAGLASRIGALPDLDALGVGAGQDTDQAIAMLQSRGFTQQFLVDEGVLPHLYPEAWDDASKSWRSDGPSFVQRVRNAVSRMVASLSGDRRRSGETAADGAPNLWDANKKFNRLRNVERDRRTQMVTLTVTWIDPVLAAQWANALVDRLNTHARQRAIQEAQRSLTYLQQEISKTSVVELQQALYRLIEGEQRKTMLASVREDYAFQVIDRALAPEERVSPHRTLMVLSGAIGGLLLGALSVLFRSHALGPRVSTR
jgi:uncharacterized protein involved in exopolysaccharide biosynthesis